jgi:hypothetical protein
MRSVIYFKGPLLFILPIQIPSKLNLSHEAETHRIVAMPIMLINKNVLQNKMSEHIENNNECLKLQLSD